MALRWKDLRTLNVPVKAGPLGMTEALMFAHGFTADMLADLVRVGLATEELETSKAHGQTINVVRVRITDAGRDALATEA